MTPKLSICIATFRRAQFIGETLESIISQATDGVEIVVLDGASPDNTAEVVASYQARFPRLRYVRAEKNSGVDSDFDKAVEQAAGEYCWLMSDDDLLKPGAISAVLDAISGGYSLVIVNAEVRSNDLSRLLQRNRLNFSANREYAAGEMDRMFVDTADYLTFIGCVVIRRSVWLARERESYFGSLFIHVGVIFQASLPAGALAMSEPFISIRYGNALWRPREFEIWMFKWPGLVWSLQGVSDAAKASVCGSEPWRNAKTLLFYRAKGTFSLTEYRRWIKPRHPSRRQAVAAQLVSLLPGALANALGVLYCKYVSRGTGMALLDLRNSRYHIRNWLAATRAP